MTREELEQLSNDTFFDNNKGEIQPARHRNFNARLIEFIEAYLDAAKRYAAEKIAELVDDAPETMDTLREVAAELKKHEDTATAMMQLIGEKLPAASYTAADVLAKLLTVDGKGSGLEADAVANQKSGAALKMWQGTEAEYNAIGTKDANTLYIVQ